MRGTPETGSSAEEERVLRRCDECAVGRSSRVLHAADLARRQDHARQRRFLCPCYVVLIPKGRVVSHCYQSAGALSTWLWVPGAKKAVSCSIRQRAFRIASSAGGPCLYAGSAENEDEAPHPRHVGILHLDAVITHPDSLVRQRDQHIADTFASECANSALARFSTDCSSTGVEVSVTPCPRAARGEH